MSTSYEGIALLAVAHVHERIRYGSQTNFLDVLKTGGRSLWCVERARAQMRAQGWSDFPERIEVMAMQAEANGCGNCGEQAAMAFTFLKKWPMAPIDYVRLRDQDHEFVVIGAEDSRSIYINDWGREATICDPWDGKAYPAGEMYSRMYNGGGPVQSLYRIASL